MRLVRFVIDGFRAFSSRQEVVMPTEPGLYLMRGDNQVDEALEGNDCGKSTLLDAIYWGLYGETTRGLRAGNVISWGSDTAIVEQTWEIDGKERTFKRQQSPNNLWIDGKNTGKGDMLIAGAIGMNGSEFLHSVMAGQFGTYFLDLSPTDKLGMFSAVLGLDYWEQASDRAKATAAGFDAAIADAESRLQNIRGKLSGMKEQLAEAKEQCAAWEKRASKQRGDAKAKKEKLRKRLAARNEALGLIAVLITEMPDEDKLAGDKVKLSCKCNQVAERIDKATIDIKLSRCPFCGGILATKWRSKLERQLAYDKAKLLLLKKECRKASELLATTRKKNADLNEQYRVIQDDLREIDQSVRELDRQQEESSANPYEETIASLRGKIAALKSDRRKTSEELDGHITARARQQYWVKGFRDLRLWVLDSTLSELEMRVNNSLVQLGLPRWSIHMAVERENKSGGVTKGFLVDVRSPESGENVSWKGWGGGVTQRLRIAAEIGLGHLITDRKGVDLGIEFWDEPDTFLSPQGVEDLMVHLKSRSISENRVVWIVSHRAIPFAFDGELLVVKSDGGSTINLV
ncbi:MAG: AAA family ATPase [bacterium]